MFIHPPNGIRAHGCGEGGKVFLVPAQQEQKKPKWPTDKDPREKRKKKKEKKRKAQQMNIANGAK